MQIQPQLENRPGDDYWKQARQPLTSLLFVLPFLATYEFGTFFLAAGDSARNGADYWLRWGLNFVGFQHPWLLPASLVGLMAAWQIAGGFRWQVSLSTLLGMFAESLLFGCCLVLVGQLEDLAFKTHFPQSIADSASSAILSVGTQDSIPMLICYLGAGVYEELLFRLCLIPAVYVALRIFLVPRRPAVFVSVVATSVLFSLAHYAGSVADPFTWFSFVFRTTAGLFFALLFVYRGFGVAVGTHAMYDVIVGLVVPAMGAQHVVEAMTAT